MKKLLTLALVLTLAAAGSRLMAEDAVTIKVTKATDKMAKVTPESKAAPVMVPITFDTGADWDAVKDTYSVSPATLKGLEHKKTCIMIGSDGTASFKAKK